MTAEPLSDAQVVDRLRSYAANPQGRQVLRELMNHAADLIEKRTALIAAITPPATEHERLQMLRLANSQADTAHHADVSKGAGPHDSITDNGTGVGSYSLPPVSANSIAKLICSTLEGDAKPWPIHHKLAVEIMNLITRGAT